MANTRNKAKDKTTRLTDETIDSRAQEVIRSITNHQHISRNPSKELDDEFTFGQRAADAVARFGGSWKFIILFGVVLICWVVLNSFILIAHNNAFDPYPYILLNLFLSMLASIQAPIILMSQNRQSEKDRLNSEHDYQVNLKAELEIMLLHKKIDLLREGQWTELLDIQKQQLQLLSDLITSQQNNK